MHKPRTMGNSIAPWRFILFFVILLIACLVGGSERGGSLARPVGRIRHRGGHLPAVVRVDPDRFCDPEVIERAAERNDANRTEFCC